MKKLSRIFAFVLALIMVASIFVACGNKEEEKENDKENVAQTNGDGSTEAATTAVPDIEVKNWGGKEYRILGKYRSDIPSLNSFEVWREGEVPEDIVGKAVWERNMDMKDNYGIEVKGILDESPNSLANTAIKAGEDLYDLFLISPEAYHPLAVTGDLLDLMKLKYINLEHDAWMDFINDQFIIGGKMYYTSNKFMLQEKFRSYILFYNRDIANELKLGHFEDYVFNNEWTIDKVIELGKQATIDKDGQPGMSKTDQWGVGVAENYSFTQFSLGAGFKFIEMGSDGYPTLIGPSSEMMSILDKVYSLVTNKEVYWCDGHYGSVDYDNCADHMFYRGDVMIFGGGLCMVDYITEVAEFEFGVLPNPKYNEKQEYYHCTPNLGNGSLMGIPVTVADSDFAGYALELISEKSVNTTYKAFVETKCKLQDVPDADAAKCLDIIFNGIVYDIGFINDLGGLGTLLRSSLATADGNNYVRFFSRVEKSANIQIEKIREAYAKIDH